MKPKQRVRLIFRLVLCLFGHLMLLLILAVYLVVSLNSVRRYTPVANAEEVQLESLDIIPTLLGSMDAERRSFQRDPNPAYLAPYDNAYWQVEQSLAGVNHAQLLVSPTENDRRAVVREWLDTVGNRLSLAARGTAADSLNAKSTLLLDRLNHLTTRVRDEVRVTLAGLQAQEAEEANGRVALMWAMVGIVTFFTILIQLALSNSIIAPIKALQNAVRSLQAGDFSARAQLRSGDEIQSLGETFNAMAENIQHHQQQLQEKNGVLSAQQEALRHANASLEERVSEKTEQIQKTLGEAEAERAKLRTLIERMPDGLLLLDDAGRIVLINDAALTVLGHRDSASLQAWMDGPPAAFSFRHLNQQALTDDEIPYRRVLCGETFSGVSIYLRGLDNQTRLVSFSGAPVHPPREGKVELSLLIFRDVTQELVLRQELEDKNQKLSEAARLKDEFLATLSHELRTPLTPIITCAHLLGDDEALKADQLKSVSVIERNARALSRMINELLDLSAVMNRKLNLAREKTEMNEWTRATLETMRPAWKKKELTVTFVPDAAPVELEIDPPRLAQVLTNLMNNAIKFTDPGGKIRVLLKSSKEEIRISVADTGAGLNRHEIDRIFEMFHQTRSKRTQGAGGLGVGLTVARSLAELHGGGLLAESRGPGRGATFTVCLPRAKHADGAEGSPANPLPPATAVDHTLLRGRRVLLVEDATDTREALQRIFERRQCRVRAAKTGEQALELAVEEPPDIILSDIGLPGLSGLELMAQLRAMPEFQEVIAIALSGLGRERDIQAAMEAGFDAHLLKPVEIAVLDQTLLDALQRRSAIQAA